jgi:hypothetical protein
MRALSKILIVIIFASFLSCSNESPFEIVSQNDFKKSEESLSLNKKMPPVPDINLADDRFKVSVFYDSIMGVDGIVSLTNSKLLVVQEYGDPGRCVFKIKKGHTFDINDAFSTIGDPFNSPDDIIVDSDGIVYVADGQAQTVFKISKHGGIPEPFVTTSTTRPSFNPFGLAIAAENFNGPNVDPGDIIVTDNAYGSIERAVWAVNPNSGVARIIAQGSVFIDGPINADFASDGTLYINQNIGTGSGRIVTLSADGTVSPFYGPIYARYQSLAIHPKTDEIFFKIFTGEIHRIPKTGGTPQLFASNIGHFQDIAFNKQGTALYLGYRDNNQVVQISGAQKIWE